MKSLGKNSPRDYSRSPLRRVTGGPLRPGGLGLTRRGLELCGFAPGARVLDVGCGAGASLALLAEQGLVPLGLDASASLLAEAGENVPGLFCLRADMHRLPLSAGSVDGILCECALSLARDKARVLGEMARALRPGGRLLLSDLVLRDADSENCGGKEMPRRAVSAPATNERAADGCAVDECATGGRVAGPPCAHGAVSGARLTALLREAGFIVLRESDETPLLRELAARIVWEFGSLTAFQELWAGAEQQARATENNALPGSAGVRENGREAGGERAVPPCGCPGRDSLRPGQPQSGQLGYSMIIAAKREEKR